MHIAMFLEKGGGSAPSWDHCVRRAKSHSITGEDSAATILCAVEEGFNEAPRTLADVETFQLCIFVAVKKLQMMEHFRHLEKGTTQRVQTAGRLG